MLLLSTTHLWLPCMTSQSDFQRLSSVDPSAPGDLHGIGLPASKATILMCLFAHAHRFACLCSLREQPALKAASQTSTTGGKQNKLAFRALCGSKPVRVVDQACACPMRVRKSLRALTLARVQVCACPRASYACPQQLLQVCACEHARATLADEQK